MNRRVLGDRVLIDADKAPEKIGSLLVVEDWKSVPPWGTVLEVGPDVTEVKPGDRVLFERYASIMLEGQERICLERHIYAVEVPDES